MEVEDEKCGRFCIWMGKDLEMLEIIVIIAPIEISVDSFNDIYKKISNIQHL